MAHGQKLGERTGSVGQEGAWSEVTGASCSAPLCYPANLRKSFPFFPSASSSVTSKQQLPTLAQGIMKIRVTKHRKVAVPPEPRPLGWTHANRHIRAPRKGEGTPGSDGDTEAGPSTSLAGVLAGGRFTCALGRSSRQREERQGHCHLLRSSQ